MRGMVAYLQLNKTTGMVKAVTEKIVFRVATITLIMHSYAFIEA